MRSDIFKAASLLLPKKAVDLTKWAVIACDQHTADREYWQSVEALVGDAPSTLRMIVPEIYLEDRPEERVAAASACMEEYLKKWLAPPWEGLIYTEREGRKGLLLCLDLEAYDYRAGTKAAVRATEKTIAERLPPRVALRRQAALELPHILLLMDDEGEDILGDVEPGALRRLYDFPLMLGGGQLRGYALEGDGAAQMLLCLHALAEKRAPGCAFAVGDGNHSLAAAKDYWESIKGSVRRDHPARYALLELVSLHDPALGILPIHRFVFGEDFSLLEGLERGEGKWVTLCHGEEERMVRLPSGRLAVEMLQGYLDERAGLSVDFIHEEAHVRRLAAEGKGLGILLPEVDRRLIFKTVEAKGILPRKSFSLGHSRDKRYYLECRMIRE